MPLAKPAGAPPLAQRRPSSSTVHGVALRDPYAWLRADNWQEVMRDPAALPVDIRAYLEAENGYADEALASIGSLKETLKAEMRGRIQEDESSVPVPDGAYEYWTRYREGGQHPILMRQPRGERDKASILIDGDALSQDEAYFRLGVTSHSPDHLHMAWSFDNKGSEKFTLKIRNLETAADLEEAILDTSGGSIAWGANAASVYYTRLDENHRPSRVYRHLLGTSVDRDELVYEEADAGFFVNVSQSQSGRFVFIDSHDHQTSEARYIDLDSSDLSPQCIAPRSIGHEYEVEHRGDHFLILTNRDGAEDFKIVTAQIAADSLDQWVEYEPHRAGRLIVGVAPFQDHVVALERLDGLPRIRIKSDGAGDGGWRTLTFDEPAFSLSLGANFEFRTDRLRISYSSPTTPRQTIDVDLNDLAKTVLKTQAVPSGHDPSAYRVERIFAPAEDGAEVPLTILTRADHLRDGSAPCLLYGYGSYGISIPASFSTNALSLVDRGMVYAIAHIRGGKDKGFAWYTEGKAKHKRNTFTDFIAARDALVETKIAHAGRIVAQGGSAGGMLMGAIANMAPDKFAGIIAQVPFVDVLNTMLDASLPLTPPEWPEWGNPIEDKEAFERIRSYSPYDQVSEQDYPAIFALAGLTDPRVTYWEPAKWIANLRSQATGDQPILLKTNMEAGHGGASGRFDRLDEIAEVYAFALKTVASS